MKEDLVFFELAQQEPFNMKVEKVGEVKMTPMFEKDEGPAEIRATVHFYILSKRNLSLNGQCSSLVTLLHEQHHCGGC
jgi:hypothetical protein